MSGNRAVLHLDGTMLEAARAGRQNFVNRLAAALASVGWRLEIARASLMAEARWAAGGPSLWHMSEPPGPGGLVIRRTYLGAFWHIERIAARWDWPVARAAFDPAGIDPDRAAAFVRQWRGQLFPGLEARREGHVFVPLQARLTERRSFQSMSPLEMLRAVIARWPDRRIAATLHPGVDHDPAELAALEALAKTHPRLELSRGGSLPLLATADLVATQNSSLAFQGYFLEKPALLFAGIDFHHPAASVPRDGLAAALEAAEAPRLPLAPYLWWFLKGHAINAGAPEAEAQILAALRRGGWAL
ncbi:hypothetical protein V8J36_04415 [Frigidibacter sp. MR17.14]|uniref:hypothetical protein n=1 Tax=Frigidibacter sp. MR17.14 TaxID=3126509 RepID=UPI0030130FEA